MATDPSQDKSTAEEVSGPDAQRSGEYVVVARRYRPQTFEELVGQQHVSQALRNAIETNRVGHAYLFSGARGVGKTSAARILGKALNCVDGPTPTPCNQCDICQSVASGDDVDVLEIDGASNRGIDEIRQLRANVNIRPSRCRFRIYIIDEVHMLTTPAFNALLKTLEEPPEHVKFIFCTTDPEKVPITVLSRCQRFDFVGIQPDAIVRRLRQIADAEGIEAENEALMLLARRATGSMRDSQSLLEQLLAFGGSRITLDNVHGMLGTAGGGRLVQLVDCLIDRNAAEALAQLDGALSEGVDAGQLVEQLLGCFRDMMAASVGCHADLMLHSAAEDHPRWVEVGKRFGLSTILAVVQILDQTVLRMRQSTHSRILAETALVRICKLEDLQQLSSLIAQLQSGVLPPAGGRGQPVTGGSRPIGSATAGQEKKKRTVDAPRPVSTGSEQTGSTVASSAALPPSASTPEPSSSTQLSETTSENPGQTDLSAPQQNSVRSLTDLSAKEIWDRAVSQIGGFLVDFASGYQDIAISAPNTLVVSFSAKYTSSKAFCERPDRRAQIEKALAAVAGQPVKLEFRLLQDVAASAPDSGRPATVSRAQRMRDTASHPLVRQTMELFDAEIVRVEEPRPVEPASGAGEKDSD